MNEITLTRKILIEDFGFAINDMGDFYMLQKNDFILLQPKCAIIEYELSFFYCKAPNKLNTFTDETINTVQDLQRLCERKGIDLKFTL